MIKTIWRKLPINHRNKIKNTTETIMGRKFYVRIQSVLGSGVFNPKIVDSRVIFIHVPKVAGTSIGNALYGCSTGHFSAEEFIDNCSLLRHSYKIVAVTRNPWERCISSYVFFKNGGTQEVKVLSSRLDYDFPETFSEFIKSWLSKKNLNKLDPVFLPQTHYLYSKSKKLLVDKIYKLEDISDFQLDVSLLLNREIHFERRNQMSGNYNLTDFFNDREVVEVFENIYADDVQLLGFSRPDELNSEYFT